MTAFWEILDRRLRFSALRYPIPESANTIGYALGAMTLFAFFVMGLTGFVLTQFYDPHPEAANTSVGWISTNPVLRYIRGLHWWTAQWIPLLLFLHMFRIVLTGSYKQNREGTWYIGVFLFLISLFLFFTGTVLKYDQEGFEALEHLEAVLEMVGILGAPLSPTLTESTPYLVRIYALHVSVLPLFLFLLIIFHLLLIKVHGISPLPGEEQTWRYQTRVTFADHLRVATLYSGGLLLVIHFMIFLWPRYGAPAPISGVEATRPPWIFLPLYPFENWFGMAPVVILPLLLVLILVGIPLIDRGARRDLEPWSRKLAVGLMTGILLFVVVFAVLSGILQPAPHMGGD